MKEKAKEIKFIKTKKIKPTKLQLRIDEILGRPSKSSSNFDKAEQAYNELKEPLDNLLSTPKTNDETEIIRQNSRISRFLDMLNKILGVLSSTPIPVFKKKVKETENKINLEEKLKEEKEKIENNNNKIMKSNEYEIQWMKRELDKIRDEKYEKNLNQNIVIKKKEILEEENLFLMLIQWYHI